MVDNLMRITFVTDLTRLEMLDASMKEIVSAGIKDTLEYIVYDFIPSRWSPTSPSSPGEPPAIVTGTLGGSLKMVRRDSAGHFATQANAVSWALQVDAEYGAALEFGVPERNLMPRPFLRPGIDEAQKILGDKIKARLDFMTNKFGTVKNPFLAQRSYLTNAIGGMG